MVSCQAPDSNTATLPTQDQMFPQRTGEINRDSSTESLVVAMQKAPIINIVDSNIVGFSFIYSSDTAANQERVTMKQNKIYSNILNPLIAAKKFAVIGPRMAVYEKLTAPYSFDVGYIFDKVEGKLPANVRVRYYKSSKALIAHFSGPYSLLNVAYSSLQEQMSQKKYESNGKPYEWYISNQADTVLKGKDPYNVRTDVIFPYKGGEGN